MRSALGLPWWLVVLVILAALALAAGGLLARPLRRVPRTRRPTVAT